MTKNKIRTTLYLDKNLKDLAAAQALREGTTLQYIFNRALRTELQKVVPSKKKKIDFVTYKLDIPYDLKRDDYYKDLK
ncbi:hypothetical protein JXA34_03570 [Patescibacteria group bacterium]|nr:hypothetical protein [Patescibacteria group bacterium]